MVVDDWLRNYTVPLLLGVIESGALAMIVADARADDIPIVYVNEAFERLTGYPAEEALGRNCRFLQGPGTDAEDLDRLRRAIAGGREATTTLLNYRNDGSEFWNRVTVAPIRDRDGRLVQFIGALSDVSEQVHAEARVREAKAEYRSFVERLPLVTYQLDHRSQRLTYVSPQIEFFTGYPPERWLDGSTLWRELLHPEDRPHVFEAQRARFREGTDLDVEYRICRADGGVVWVWDRDTLVRDDDGGIRRSDGVLVDITARKEAEVALEHQVLHDPLTGLANRKLLMDRLEHAIGLSTRRETEVGVLCFDLDRFKAINDTLGHYAGDDVLRALVPRIRGALRDCDTPRAFRRRRVRGDSRERRRS